jgi:hypothetical protein
MFYSRALTIVFHQLVFIVDNLGIFLLITVSISKIFSHRNYLLLIYFQDCLCTWDYLFWLKTCAWWALFNISYHFICLWILIAFHSWIVDWNWYDFVNLFLDFCFLLATLEFVAVCFLFFKVFSKKIKILFFYFKLIFFYFISFWFVNVKNNFKKIKNFIFIHF